MPFREKTDKYKIICSDPDTILMKEIAKSTEPMLMKEDTSMINIMMNMLNLTYTLNDNALSDPMMKELIKDPNTHFDLVIVQPIMNSETGYYLAHKFKAPFAIYNTAQSHVPFINTAVGQPYNPSYMTFGIMHFLRAESFSQRLMNTVASFMAEHIFRNIIMLGQANELLDKHFPGEIRPSLLALERNASVAFSFGHPLLLDGWSPMVPNYVQLGMMNCRPGKPFEPNDPIGQFLNNSKNGVVFMSFGSIIQPSLMTKESKQIFLNTFKKFPQYDFIWKWDEKLPNLPKNVFVSNWLPQQDILAHPNLKVFITHAGQSSSQEAMCHQKPAMAIPVQGDQIINGLEIERLGFGLSLNYMDLKEEELGTVW